MAEPPAQGSSQDSQEHSSQPPAREHRLEALSHLAAQQQSQSSVSESSTPSVAPTWGSPAPSGPGLPFWRRVPFWLGVIGLLGVVGTLLWHQQVQALQPVSPTACAWSTAADATGALLLGPPTNRVAEGSYTVLLQRNTCDQQLWQATGTMSITGSNEACTKGTFTLDLESNKQSVETTKMHGTLGDPTGESCADRSQVMAITLPFENTSTTPAMCAELQSVFWVNPDPQIQAGRAGSDCQ